MFSNCVGDLLQITCDEQIRTNNQIKLTNDMEKEIDSDQLFEGMT